MRKRAETPLVQGLSPRVRGNRWRWHNALCHQGSIPACAGEPKSALQHLQQQRVYPRVCGGTGAMLRPAGQNHGLSPRVRGNPIANIHRQLHPRSIPACAGEPPRHTAATSPAQVYPRVCGGTGFRAQVRLGLRGLSPRVRGNRSAGRRSARTARSIPACAGEPNSRPAATTHRWVYPRVCGGTVAGQPFVGDSDGLSPRVRGNQRRSRALAEQQRSIPACAGEPNWGWGGGVAGGVYPRVCGGTGAAIHPRLSRAGLSPRVRGNHQSQASKSGSGGSIPACAGEPSPPTGVRAGGSVYPRVCGGTFHCHCRLPPGSGLSPRVRGNPPQRHS